MGDSKFITLKNQVQGIINLMAKKEFIDANYKLLDAEESLEELLDFSKEDEDLIEISKYQVLLNQLQQKIQITLK